LFGNKTPDIRYPVDTITSDSVQYIVYYSIDTVLQACASKLFDRYHPKYGALAVIEPATGRVRALYSYTRSGIVSYGNDLWRRSIFPAASLIKIVTSASAIEKAGLTPESIFPLAGGKWTLYNFQLKEHVGCSQPVTLEDAFAHSMNPIFGRIGIYFVGIPGLLEYMQKFGFNSQFAFDIPAECPSAAVSINDSLLSIAEVASGYNRVTKISPLYGAMLAGTVVEGGKMNTPSLVDSIVAIGTGTVYRAQQQVWRTPMLERTASLIKGMMETVIAKGTARKSFGAARQGSLFNDIDCGGKTGSVDEDNLGKIDWFAGFINNNQNPLQRLSIAVVTVHDAYWTVHSGYVAEEMFRTSLRGSIPESFAMNTPLYRPTAHRIKHHRIKKHNSTKRIAAKHHKNRRSV
jgi:cell division protein FtsI/penicillin-binding protein 2